MGLGPGDPDAVPCQSIINATGILIKDYLIARITIGREKMTCTLYRNDGILRFMCQQDPWPVTSHKVHNAHGFKFFCGRGMSTEQDVISISMNFIVWQGIRYTGNGYNSGHLFRRQIKTCPKGEMSPG